MHPRARLLSGLILAATGAALADDATKKTPATEAPRTTKVTAAPATTQPAAPRTLEEAMRRLARRRVDVDFRELPLDEFVSFVGRLTQMNVVLSPAYLKKSGGALPTVTVRLRDVSLRQVAELVAKEVQAGFALRDGILFVTTPEDARGEPVLRVFSIHDLTFRIRNFPGPDINLHVGGAQIVQEEESDQESPFDDPQHVIELLKKFTGAGTWDDEGVSIEGDERKLVIRQYPAVLKEIARFLAVLRSVK